MATNTDKAPTPAKPKRGRSGFVWDAFTVALVHAFSKGSSLITGIIIARLLGPEGRGLVSALMVPATLAQNFSEMGVRQSTAFHLGRGIFSVERLLPTLLLLVPISSAIAIGASLIYMDFVGLSSQSIWIQFLAVAAIPTSLTSSYATGVFLGRQKIAAFRKASWRPTLVRMALLILLGWGLGWGIYGVMLANIGAGLAGAGYALYLLGKEGPLRLGFDREVAVKLQRRGLAYASALFVLMLNYRIMVLLLTKYGTLHDVGIYSQATALAELIWEIPAAVSALLLSRSVNAKEEKAFSVKVLVLARLSFLGAVVIGIGLAIVSPWFFPLLFGSGFAESAGICNMLLPGVAAFIVFKILNTDLAGRGKPWVSLIVMLPVLGCNIGLGLWLIELHGAYGAAMASSATYGLATVLYVLLYARITGFRLSEIVLFRYSDFTMLLDKLSFLRPSSKNRGLS